MKLISILIIFLLAINSWAATPIERAQDITTMKPLSAKPSTPTTGAKLYYKDQKLRVLESSGVEKALGSADLQGNFFLNGGFEYGSTVGWTGPITATTAQTRAGDWAGLISTTSATMSVTATITLSEGYAAGTDVKVGIDLKTDLADNVVYFCGLADTTETSCTPMTGNAYKRIEVPVTVPNSRVVGFKIKTLSAVTTSATYVDKGYIGEWNIGKVSNIQQESVSYSGYTSKDASNRAKFTSKNYTLSSNGMMLSDDNSGAFTKKTALKKCFITSMLSWYSPTTTTTFYINHYNVSGNLLSSSSTGKAASLYQTTPYTAKMEKGDYLAVVTPDAASAPFVWTTNAQSVSDDVVTSANAPRSYDLTVTGTNWTTTKATGVYYRSGNQHRFKYNIVGSVSSASRGSYNITVPGVSFGSTQSVSFLTDNNVTPIRAYVGGSIVYIEHTSGTTSFYSTSGDVELTAKPTWADDVSTQYSAAIPRNHVAIIQYRGNGSRVTLTTTPVAMPLSVVKGDTSIVSIANNQFTLQPGEYDVSFHPYGGYEAATQLGSLLYGVSGQYTGEIERGSLLYSGAVAERIENPLTTRLSLNQTSAFEYRVYKSGTGNVYCGTTTVAPNDLNGFIRITKLDRN